MRSTPVLFVAAIVLSGCSSTATQPPSPPPTIASPDATAIAPTLTPTATVTVGSGPTATMIAVEAFGSGVRSDLKDCAAAKTDLPVGAKAGLVCHPKSSVVSRVTLYLFDTQLDLLGAYVARLDAHDVPRRTAEGRCLTGKPSEGAYVPEGGGYAPDRNGCYLDTRGDAHYVATLPPYVLAEVDGKVHDMAAVEHWAWKGNLDQPGSPTVWRNPE